MSVGLWVLVKFKFTGTVGILVLFCQFRGSPFTLSKRDNYASTAACKRTRSSLFRSIPSMLSSGILMVMFI
ncbi:hypothetical protein BJP34_04450 [Moorena producens PAL-8-15-08-1]|uniref:Uncharacterized protein n=1 Tax=Moorena producens PAL-8-15-08-1 TaxID=1458985 RepID=A0A1D8TMK4_9CYAN|nr:hypothetical protein BJP34_04450 [Moorena producens PAL-8-15-08-1]